VSEVGDILHDAEVERLIADRANLPYQRNFQPLEDGDVIISSETGAQS